MVQTKGRTRGNPILLDAALSLRMAKEQQARFTEAARRRHLPLTTWIRQICEDAAAEVLSEEVE